MPFATSVFLVLFLPALLLAHRLAPGRLRGPLLLAASLGFYAWGAPRFVFVVVATTMVDFLLVRRMAASRSESGRKLLLSLSIGLNVSLLVVFKYGGFLAENVAALERLFGATGPLSWPAIALPLGISFYTFETVTYVVDVYRRVHPPLSSPWLYQLYIFFFPKMIAGPIVRYREIADQLPGPHRRVEAGDWLAGFVRLSTGLGKKVLLANPLSEIVDGVYGNPSAGWAGLDPAAVGPGTAWLAAVSTLLQVYFDFSGYSDMALGMARMLGFRLPENFDHPMVSGSFTEFWRRWHMTLGRWMRDYLYVPLGGNRGGALRLHVNLVLVFLICGLWHGAAWTYVLWGGFHGAMLLAERAVLLRRMEGVASPIRIALTFAGVSASMPLFRAADLDSAAGHLLSLAGLGAGTATFPLGVERGAVLVAALVFSFFRLLPGGARLSDRLLADVPRPGDLPAMTMAALVLFLLSLAHLTASGFRPFVYFRF